MAAALIVGQAQREALAALRALAEREPIDVRTLAAESATPEGEARVRERMMRYTVDVPHGYRVTFSVETGHSVGTVRHLSMSLDRPGKVPHPAAAWAVADLLGFWGSIDDCVGCWPEEVGAGRTAINLVQLLERPEKGPRLQAQVFELDDGATPEMRKHIPLITNATIQMTELFHTAPLPARFGIVSSFLLSVLPYSEDPAACWEAVKKRVDSLLADSIAKYEGMHAPAVAQNGETTP